MTNVSGPWNQPPRSTPIPGSEPINAPEGLDQQPPTAAQFLAGAGAPPMAPTGPPPLPNVPQMPPHMVPQGIPATFQPGTAPTYGFGNATRRKRGGLGMVLAVFAVLVTVGGIGVGVWAVVKGVETANEATSRADELTDPTLSAGDRAALGLTGTERFLWEGRGMERTAAVYEEVLAGAPTNFIALQFYGDYAFAVVQSPIAPNQVDQYGWRLGVVDAPTPQQNDDEASLKVFTIDQIDWVAVSAAVAGAPALLGIPDGTISHVIIDKPAFIDVEPLSVKVYVTSDRDSGYVRLAPDGTVMATY